PYDGTGISTIEGFVHLGKTFADNDMASLRGRSALTASDTSATSSLFINNFLPELLSRMTQWLAGAGNGIEKLIAKQTVPTNVNANGGAFQDLCVGSVCVTESQFLSFLGAAASQSAAAGSVASSTPIPASPAPTLTINGNNPAKWQLGTAWQDNLG